MFGGYIVKLFPKWKQFMGPYYLNDRIAHSSTSAITSSHIIAVPRSTLKAKVGITPFSGNNSNFSYDIKRRTWFDLASNQVLFLVRENITDYFTLQLSFNGTEHTFGVNFWGAIMKKVKNKFDDMDAVSNCLQKDRFWQKRSFVYIQDEIGDIIPLGTSMFA